MKSLRNRTRTQLEPDFPALVFSSSEKCIYTYIYNVYPPEILKLKNKRLRHRKRKKERKEIEKKDKKMSTTLPSSINQKQNDIAKHFRALHNPRNPVILANVYDAATASIVATLPSATAVATASYGVAATIGVEDNSMTKSQNLAVVSHIATAIQRIRPELPLTVDIQDGYGDTAELASTIREIIALGAVGCNLEDVNNATGTLIPLSVAAERVRVAIQTAKEAGVPDFVINARTDVLGEVDGASVRDVIERGKAFLEAGACTVFVWGGPRGRGVSSDEVRELVSALDGRISVKMNLREGYLNVSQIKALGVARVSVGPELFRAAMQTFKERAEEMLLLK
jgi:2-methylisocitrate lyase-like PEP mutase family enzyme